MMAWAVVGGKVRSAVSADGRRWFVIDPKTMAYTRELTKVGTPLYETVDEAREAALKENLR